MSLKFNLPNKEKVFDRLMQEPMDTALFIDTFFGRENATRYLEIMSQRIYHFRAMVESLIAGDLADTENHFAELIDLAERMADFFYELSSVYPRDEWAQLLRQYEQLMRQQAEAVVTGNYDLEISLSDQIIDQITQITEHVAKVIAVALGWSSIPEVKVTTAIWRLPGR